MATITYGAFPSPDEFLQELGYDPRTYDPLFFAFDDPAGTTALSDDGASFDFTFWDLEHDGQGYELVLRYTPIDEESVYITANSAAAGFPGLVFQEGAIDFIEISLGDEIVATITDLSDFAPYVLSHHFWTNTDISALANVPVMDLILGTDNIYAGSKSTSDFDDYGNDVIHTGLGNDTVKALSGHDTIYDLYGSDSYNGGAGRDLLSYSKAIDEIQYVKHGIDADLKQGTIIGYDGLTDTVVGIQNIEGTFLDDVIKGNGADNYFIGFAGHDEFNGRGGYDIVDYDDAEYQGGIDGIIVDMKTDTIRDAFGYTDTIQNIEMIRGTDVQDEFIDDGSSMYYFGDDGNDVFRIRGGSDIINGESDSDTIIFLGKSFGANTILNWDKTEDTLKINKLTSMDQVSLTQDEFGTVAQITIDDKVSYIAFDETHISELTDDVFGF